MMQKELILHKFYVCWLLDPNKLRPMLWDDTDSILLHVNTKRQTALAAGLLGSKNRRELK